MKKLPNINKFEINKKIKNNKVVFDSLKENIEVSKNELKKIDEKECKRTKKDLRNLSVSEKLKELINKNSYIFNMKVNLVFSTHQEVCQIAGIVNNHIITMDNRIIKIADILDIEILEK